MCGANATFRSRAKHAAERFVAHTPVPALLRRGARGTVVLAYHNVVPRGERAAGDRSLHLPQDDFARQLDALAATHDVVPLPEMLRPARSRRPRAVVTFDDGYRGALTAGLEELAKRGMPATFFVVPGLAAGHGYWWDEMVQPGAAGLPEAFRAAALGVLGGREVPIRRSVPLPGAHPLPWHATVAGEAEMRAAGRTPGISLGSHGWTHANLTALSGRELEDELVRPLRALRQKFGCAIPWLSYPYGLFSAEVERAAAAAGYEGAVRVGGGPLRATGQRMAVPRVNVPAGLSHDGFVLRAAGLPLG
jgi:peptidoglycan/xylan/chitin deacetylase (PgdA/CDA1 family)